MEMVRQLVSDRLWELFLRVMPEAPVRPQGGGRRRADDRGVLAAILFVATSGCTWRQLPSMFGASWQTALADSRTGRSPRLGQTAPPGPRRTRHRRRPGLVAVSDRLGESDSNQDRQRFRAAARQNVASIRRNTVQVPASQHSNDPARESVGELRTPGAARLTWALIRDTAAKGGGSRRASRGCPGAREPGGPGLGPAGRSADRAPLHQDRSPGP
ncbi:transposase [Streptomyces sp. MBT57]|nr:transposase [Streptomyces sp. MBT57]